MTRLAWVTDSHLDHSGPILRNDLAIETRDKSDCCVITGDISNGRQICQDLRAFVEVYGKPVYFITGNHDFYGSSFADVNRRLADLCQRQPLLVRLLPGEVHNIGNAQLCGTDGWYDYRAGWCTDRLNITMNDWPEIAELAGPFAHYKASADSGPLVRKFRELAGLSVDSANESMAAVDTSKPIFFATHVPPFAEASWHDGDQGDPTYLPFFTNIALGKALNSWADFLADTKLTTLCGHCHSRGSYRARDNHLVLTGAAQYGNPRIERIFEV